MEISILIFGCSAAFFAGFVDAIAGGGGLIQVPALLFLLPNIPIVNLLGTNKLAMGFGTIISSAHYVRSLKIDLKIFLPTLIIAFICAILGAKILSVIDNEILKPLVFFLLILIAVYTFKKGSGFVSWIFLAVVGGMLIQMLPHILR